MQTLTLKITHEVLKLIAEIDKFKGAWAAIGRISSDRLTSLRRVATIESIGSSTRIEGARLTDLEVDWTRRSSKEGELHPLVVIAVFVVVFLEIHPFQDGNGRLSRVLTTLLLLRAGYTCVPYSSLESVIERSKDQYYLALRQTQSTIRTEAPDWQPWYSLG